MQPVQPPNALVPMGKTIHINPNFGKIVSHGCSKVPLATATHINPLFINMHPPPPMRIHMNPDFLARDRHVYANPIFMHQQDLIPNVRPYCEVNEGLLVPGSIVKEQAEAKIIAKSRTRLVRQPVKKQEAIKPLLPTKKPPNPATVQTAQPPLIRVHKRKLVRLGTGSEATGLPPPTNTDLSNKKYKLNYNDNDRSALPSTTPASMSNSIHNFSKLNSRPFVARYALHRAAAAADAADMKENGQSSQIIPMRATRWNGVTDTSLRMLNINGLMYKCTHNKLQRKSDGLEAKPSAIKPQTAKKAAESDYTKSAGNSEMNTKPTTLNGDEHLLFPDLFNTYNITSTQAHVWPEVQRFQYIRPTTTASSVASASNVHGLAKPAAAAKTTPPAATNYKSKSLLGRALYVNGVKYVADPFGFKLTRVSLASEMPEPYLGGASLAKSVAHSASFVAPEQRYRTRLDIGGLTYIAGHSNNQNVLVRTSNHKTRAHLTQARNRSMNMLRLVKTNVPCAIYQRVGKCAAYERGKCVKKHDKNQVKICSRFLRGECNNANCLLSHSVSLAKMPVCKFFLQGVCMRTDCPYLHKKLSVKTEICIDFSQGYCKLADKCPKRHEFICSVLARTGECNDAKCKDCSVRRQLLSEHERSKHLKKQMEDTINDRTNNGAHPSVAPKTNEEKLSAVLAPRYFEKKTTATANDMRTAIQDSADVAVESIAVPAKANRPKLGVLPAYIPLSK